MSNKLLLAAILPSVILLVYIYRKDKVEKEPLGMLVGLFLLGALTTVSAAIIEIALERVLMRVVSRYSVTYIAVKNFLIVGLAEEAGKYFVLKKRTWRSPHFNFTFDAVVYAVAVSLGFATLENVLYVRTGGMETAMMRAVFSIPAHTINAVFMGCFYGLARQAQEWGEHSAVKHYLRLALWVAVLTHGFYDFCLSMDQEIFSTIFLVYDVIITVVAFRTVRFLSRQDTPIN